jgi:hypothetical protein
MLADIGVAVLLLIGVYCFLRMIGWRTGELTRKSDRRAEDLYDRYADSPRKQRTYAKERGGQWTDGSTSWHSSPPHSS